MRTEALTWIGIEFCIAQSAFFAGLNLAIFSVSRLRLEVEAAGGNANAVRLLELRRDSNLTLAAIVWGNVGTNVLLTLLSGSVLRGLAAFAFSSRSELSPALISSGDCCAGSRPRKTLQRRRCSIRREEQHNPVRARACEIEPPTGELARAVYTNEEPAWIP